MDTVAKNQNITLWWADMTKKRKSSSIIFEKAQSEEPTEKKSESKTFNKSLEEVSKTKAVKTDKVKEVPNLSTSSSPEPLELETPANPEPNQSKSFWSRKPKPPVYEVSDQDHLAKIDISKRRGNYILAIGLPESGKTTLQSFMTYFLTVGNDFNADLDVAERNGDINHQAQYLFTNWLEKWQMGEYPDSTPVGEDEIREIRLDVENKQNKKQKFNLSFLEISGENFSSIVPDRYQVPTLFNRLRDFINNTKINLNIVLVVKPNPETGSGTDDALFANFFVFVKNQLKLTISDRCGLIILVPNPSAIFPQDSWTAAQKDKKLYNKLVLDHVYASCPATYKIFTTWNKKKRAILPFNIGESSEEKLTKRDFRDVNVFVRLNYQLFTGKVLREPFWKRLTGKGTL